MDEMHMIEKPDMVKAGAVITNDQGHLLVVRKKGLDTWIALGGRQEENEPLEQTVIREVKEETGLDVIGAPELYHTSPIEPVAGQPDLTIIVYTYIVQVAGEPKLNPEDSVEEFHWLSKEEFENGKFILGSVLEKFVIPKLIADGLMR